MILAADGGRAGKRSQKDMEGRAAAAVAVVASGDCGEGNGDSLLVMFALMFTPQQRYIRTREAAELRLGILLAAARALL
jgi:hypothetical protein